MLKNTSYSLYGASALCAIAASKAALCALITGEFQDPVGIILPKGEVPYFTLSIESLSENYAMAGIIKDKNILPDIGCFKDDDDRIANGTIITALVHPAPPKSGLIVQFDDGVTIKDQQVLSDESFKLMRSICMAICNDYNIPTDIGILISTMR